MNENLKFKEQWAMKQNKIFNWIIISSREMLFPATLVPEALVLKGDEAERKSF